jgi:hypothetical protein
MDSHHDRHSYHGDAIIIMDESVYFLDIVEMAILAMGGMQRREVFRFDGRRDAAERFVRNVLACYNPASHGFLISHDVDQLWVVRVLLRFDQRSPCIGVHRVLPGLALGSSFALAVFLSLALAPAQ